MARVCRASQGFSCVDLPGEAPQGGGADASVLVERATTRAASKLDGWSFIWYFMVSNARDESWAATLGQNGSDIYISELGC